MQHWHDVAAEEKRSGTDKLTLRYPQHKFKYDWHWIAMAVDLEDAMEVVILNPRNIQAKSLKEADSDWLKDKARYRQGRRFVRDRDKRAKVGLG